MHKAEGGFLHRRVHNSNKSFIYSSAHVWKQVWRLGPYSQRHLPNTWDCEGVDVSFHLPTEARQRHMILWVQSEEQTDVFKSLFTAKRFVLTGFYNPGELSQLWWRCWGTQPRLGSSPCVWLADTVPCHMTLCCVAEEVEPDSAATFCRSKDPSVCHCAERCVSPLQ